MKAMFGAVARATVRGAIMGALTRAEAMGKDSDRAMMDRVLLFGL